ncbi:MAG: SPOR domain-containing protein, partial [Bacteroidales bacterium]|nr:SPOR domain-containing protein [Bacteroidales bacterium]
DDKILISYISDKEMIDESEIERKVNEFTEKIENVLKTEGKYYLKGIGVLIKDNDNIFLKQDYRSNLLYEAYGMKEVPISFAQREAGEELKKEKKSFHRIYNKETTVKRILIYTPIAAVVVLVLIYLDINRIYDSNDLQGFDYQSNYTVQEEVKPADIVPAAEVEKEKEIIQVIDQITDKREALLYKEPAKPSYYIIAGSFKSFVNARQFYDELRAKGYPSHILDKEGELYRVAIKKLSTKNEAEKELQQLKRTYSQSIWVLSK